MTEELVITCIVCPMGCRIRVLKKDGEVIAVKGYSCPRGREYAVQEATRPLRVLMTVIPCINGDLPVVSVKTSKPIPRDKLLEVSRYLASVSVEAPVEIGDVIVENILGLGADIVATRPCKRVKN